MSQRLLASIFQKPSAETSLGAAGTSARAPAMLAAVIALVGVPFIQAQVVSPPSNLAEVRRVYVGELVGAQASELRELIIASLDSTRLFAITDNPDRADAVLKGAANDQAFTDTYDATEGISTRENSGKYSGSGYSKAGGIYGGLSLSDSHSLHTKERKHEAYASVRLCNKEGDVLWSTTQESLGAKFRGASADVASKIARQLTLDVDKAKRGVARMP